MCFESTVPGGSAVADGPTKNSKARLTGVDGGPIHAWADDKTHRRKMFGCVCVQNSTAVSSGQTTRKNNHH